MNIRWKKDRNDGLDTETAYIGKCVVGRVFMSPFGPETAWQCLLPHSKGGIIAGRERSVRTAKVCVEDEVEEWFDGLDA